ncbi:hypothetical protein L3V82_04940 [Thiotrichales bacterium 19S3-7]|nr:hypothetical protein [Thiotrichales bacterium 19S3-7]MCF6801439.1 hypothetical protein [Thiotrichales bacterium 19S3-11]
MKFHTVIDMDDADYRKPFFESFNPTEVRIELPTALVDLDRQMTGVQWINKLKQNDLTAKERLYVEQMREIATKYDALVIPAGSWDGLSSQNYTEHRNKKRHSDFFLYLSKPETLTVQEMADLTAIHCHKELGHSIVGECHGLQAYHLYHQGKLGVFEAGIILECVEDRSLRVNDGKFEHRPKLCETSVDTPSSSWHQDWNHNTFALMTDEMQYQSVEANHPLQSDKLTWIARPSGIYTCGIHVINGINHWLDGYNLDEVVVTYKEQGKTSIGIYLPAEKDEAYESDDQRGDDTYTSAKEKLYHAASWAKMHADAKAMSREYEAILATVSTLTGINLSDVERDFEATIFQHIANAYIERIPGKIITQITQGKDYLTQYHPSKSIDLVYGMKELEQRNTACGIKVLESVEPSAIGTEIVGPSYLFFDRNEVPATQMKTNIQINVESN